MSDDRIISDLEHVKSYTEKNILSKEDQARVLDLLWRITCNVRFAEERLKKTG